MSEAQAGNRTYPKWQQARLSHSSSLHYFSALGLPSCQEGNGHEGPDCMSWLCREQESGLCLQTSHHVQKNRCAAQSCRAPSHQSLCCTDSQGWVKPRTLPILQVLSPHVAAAKHWPPGKHWISATVQHLLFCRDTQMWGERQGWASPERQGHKRNTHTLVWVSGVWYGYQEVDRIKVKRKRLKSVYSTSHLPALSITCFLKSSLSKPRFYQL